MKPKEKSLTLDPSLEKLLAGEFTTDFDRSKVLSIGSLVTAAYTKGEQIGRYGRGGFVIREYFPDWAEITSFNIHTSPVDDTRDRLVEFSLSIRGINRTRGALDLRVLSKSDDAGNTSSDLLVSQSSPAKESRFSLKPREESDPELASDQLAIAKYAASFFQAAFKESQVDHVPLGYN